MSDRKQRSAGPPPTHRGYSPWEVVSALQKAIRRSQEEDAIYWALELDNSNFTGWAWARLKVIASEDIGIADTQAVLLVHILYAAWADARKKDKEAKGGLFLVHATLALARAQKSRIADSALIALGEEAEWRPIPDVALDIHTRQGKQMGRGWSFFFEASGLLADPETGELSEDGSTTPDPYREAARQVLESGHRASEGLPGSVAEQVEQLRLEQDGEGS
jgi:MgsA AAA+ ATPase C terminal